MHSTCPCTPVKGTQLRSHLLRLQAAGWTGIASGLRAVDACDRTRPAVALLPDGLACYMQAEVVHGLSGDEVSTRAAIHSAVCTVCCTLIMSAEQLPACWARLTPATS